jgi:hypothetical protein
MSLHKRVAREVAKRKQAEARERTRMLAAMAMEPGHVGFCEAARDHYECGEATCCDACHENPEFMSRVEDGDDAYHVCCALRHQLCGDPRLEHAPVVAELN